MRQSGFTIQNSLFKIPVILAAEMKESFLMAMGALVAHKLRSALTLLGVMVGVFSIIVVMTTMRAMEKNIERNFAQLGGDTFVVRKWPRVHFDSPGGSQEYWRRKNISLEQGLALISRATLPRSIGLEQGLGSGNMTSRYAQGPPNVSLRGETPGSFPAQDWTIEEGRALVDSDVDSQRDVCVLGNSSGPATVPPRLRPSAKKSITTASITRSSACWKPKATMPGGMQDNFAIIPITTGLTRYYRKAMDQHQHSGAGAQPGGLRRHRGPGARHHARFAQGPARPAG